MFLERREWGVINIGDGILTLDGVAHPLVKGDGFYVGKGTKEVVFTSKNPKDPAEFYLASAPAHQTYPTVKIEFAKANPRRVGSPDTVNVRTIYRYVHPAVCQSCQLVMGMTILAMGSVWNTVPCHTHETRHLVVADRQAVISPPWSILSGVDAVQDRALEIFDSDILPRLSARENGRARVLGAGAPRPGGSGRTTRAPGFLERGGSSPPLHTRRNTGAF